MVKTGSDLTVSDAWGVSFDSQGSFLFIAMDQANVCLMNIAGGTGMKCMGIKP
jgi:hypothetical protein